MNQEQAEFQVFKEEMLEGENRYHYENFTNEQIDDEVMKRIKEQQNL